MTEQQYAHWLTKKQVAEMMDITDRTVENLIAKGKLQAVKIRGNRNAPTSVINPDDVAREMAGKGQTPGFLMPAEATREMQVAATPPMALLDALTKGIADGVAKAIGAANSRQSVPLTAKVYLTMEEAMELSGLSRRYLLDRIKDEKLTAFKSGLSGRGGWRIRREGLMKL